MAPVFFPVFLPVQGGPAVLGLGSLLTGGLLPGLDPLGVLQLQGLLGFGADGRGLELLSDLPLEPFGVDPRPGHGAGGKRRGQGASEAAEKETEKNGGVLWKRET